MSYNEATGAFFVLYNDLVEPRRRPVMKTKKELWGRPAKIDLPPSLPPTPDELERRQKAVRELLKLREEIGLVDMTLEEFLAGDRPEEA